MHKHLLLTAGAMLAVLLSSEAPRAQAPGVSANERWLCTEKVASGAERAPTEYLVENGSLIAQPLGAPRYRVLDNTPFGLIAADYSADLDLGFVDVYIATLMIDRGTGTFMATNSVSGGTPEARMGQCHLVTAATIGASAQKK
jgi:hypothetical protein